MRCVHSLVFTCGLILLPMPSKLPSPRATYLVNTSHVLSETCRIVEAAAADSATVSLLSSVLPLVCSQLPLVYEPLCAHAALELGLLVTQHMILESCLEAETLPTDFAIMSNTSRVFRALVFLVLMRSLECHGAYVTLIGINALMLSLIKDKDIID